MASRSRTFHGFAVVAKPDGSLIWGTMRPAQADAWAAYARHNPEIEGFPSGAQLVAVSLTVEPIKPE